MGNATRLAFVGCVLWACTPSGHPTDPKNDEPDPEKPSVVLGDPGIERASCDPGSGAPGFRMLATATSNDARIGTCGEVVWRDDQRAVFFAGRDAEPRHLNRPGQPPSPTAPLWFSGDRIAWVDDLGVVVEAGGAVVRTWPVLGVHLGGKLPGADAFWTCSPERGIERLDGEGVTGLTPDFVKAEWGVGCFSIDPSPAGVIAYGTSDHQIGVVDLVSGDRKRLSHPYFPDGTVDDEDVYRMDAIRLSPDASFVMHEKRWVEYGDHTFEDRGENVVSVLPIDGKPPVRLPGGLVDTWYFGGVGGGWSWYGPWMATAPGVFLPGVEGAAHLLGLDGPVGFDFLLAKAIRGNHLFAESPHGAALLELDSGSLHELFDAPGLEHVVPFRWGGPVAFSWYTRACVHWPDRPDRCHTELWALSLWDEENGAGRIALASEPIHVHAIGPDGQMVIEGRIFDEAPADIEEPRDIPWRTLLLDPGGKLVREIDGGTGIERGHGGTYFALIERERREGDIRTEELVAIDWITGAETILVTGRFIDKWTLDHADRRVTVLVTPMEDTRSFQLWSGVVSL